MSFFVAVMLALFVVTSSSDNTVELTIEHIVQLCGKEPRKCRGAFIEDRRGRVYRIYDIEESFTVKLRDLLNYEEKKMLRHNYVRIFLPADKEWSAASAKHSEQFLHR
jgi:hypothetical protein